jgi:lysyl-tRNA synthetase class 2
MKISVHPRIFRLFPGYHRCVVIAEGVSNTGESDVLTAMLRDAEESVRSNPTLREHRSNPSIAAWRNAFTSFGLNPNPNPPSVEGLVKRVIGGKTLPFISPLVTIFNIQSLRYLVPLGGDDLDTVTGDLELCFADGTETYLPLGGGAEEHPRDGEVVYKDSRSGDVFCRGWCWRNGERSKIRPETRNVAINVDALPPATPELARKAAGETAELVRVHCGGNVRVCDLSEASPGVTVGE